MILILLCKLYSVLSLDIHHHQVVTHPHHVVTHPNQLVTHPNHQVYHPHHLVTHPHHLVRFQRVDNSDGNYYRQIESTPVQYHRGDPVIPSHIGTGQQTRNTHSRQQVNNMYRGQQVKNGYNRQQATSLKWGTQITNEYSSDQLKNTNKRVHAYKEEQAYKGKQSYKGRIAYKGEEASNGEHSTNSYQEDPDYQDLKDRQDTGENLSPRPEHSQTLLLNNLYSVYKKNVWTILLAVSSAIIAAILHV